MEDICWSSTFTRPTYPYEEVTQSRCRRQVLVFGNDEKEYFLKTSMVFPNAKGEAILPKLEAIENSPDAKDESFAYSNNGRVLYVKPSGNTLKVESFKTTQASGGAYEQRSKVDEYTLRNCR